MNDAGPNPLAVFVLSAAARELLSEGLDPRVLEEVLAPVRVDVVSRGAARSQEVVAPRIAFVRVLGSFERIKRRYTSRS